MRNLFEFSQEVTWAETRQTLGEVSEWKGFDCSLIAELLLDLVEVSLWEEDDLDTLVTEDLLADLVF